MTSEITLTEILKGAIQKEIVSWLLYKSLSRRMSQEIAKDAFNKLARQEKEHQNRLEAYRRGEVKEGTLPGAQAVDYKLTEYLEQPTIHPEMSFKDIFLLAANRERASHELYLRLAEIHPAGEAKKLLEELAAQELGHKQQLELLYTEVAFPQTDGG
ncbi:ferritin family protein [Chloroflexota bacterium]